MIKPWEGAMTPFRIYGDVYFVGTVPASAHLDRHRRGLILLDTAIRTRCTWCLKASGGWGFDPFDLKILLLSHGHMTIWARRKARESPVRRRTSVRRMSRTPTVRST